jgi:hypothetical protein
MKKILMLMAVAMLVLGISGQAMAAFVTTDLIRVVYGVGSDGKAYEYATDLGSVASSLTAPLIGNMVFTADPINFSTFGTTPITSLSVAYYMYTSTSAGDPTNQVWASGISPNGQWNGNRKFAGFNTNALENLTAYNSNLVTGAPNNAKLEVGSGAFTVELGAGNLGTYLNTGTQHPGTGTDMSLVASGYVDQYLYYYSSTQNTSTYGGGPGTKIATIRTFSDGHTELLGANPVPVPAAVYLLGSGLLGLIGIRRRMMA